MEQRSYEIRAVDKEAREVTGIAVPYNETIDIGGYYKERFAQGAIGNDVTDVKLFWMHQEPIGRVVKGEETPDGYSITARLSETPRGEEAYTLLKDGVINRFSVGFEPVSDREEDDVIVRTEVRLREVSLVPFPAYDKALVAEVRSETPTPSTEETSMPTENTEVTDLREAVTDLERRFAVLGENPTRGTSGLEIRSAGEFIKGLVDGTSRDKVESYNRAYTGATTTDSNPQVGWVQKTINIVQENRDTLNLFEKGPLPATGMSVDYPKLSSVSGTVAAQAAEGDDLGYLEVVITDASTPVKTYGGYSQLTRQAIERSDVPYLSKVFEYQTMQYAKATNAAVRTVLTGGTGYQTATLAADTAKGWLDLAIDASGLIHDNGVGAEAEFILMSNDVFKRVATIVDSAGRPLFVVNGDGTNTIGAVTRGRRGNIAGLSIVVDPGLAANSLYIGAAEAITVWEAAGAPFRLEDENIINLSKNFSLYGYMASAVTNAKAVVKVDADLTP
ncbi:HK97 family phage prohead protease [Streptomyces sp. NPDC060223]|uniref:HK97 family phage prohead protease n=1 Tax=unclassified Streptomyces TaxID=2593676 RepID=UPI00363F0291